MTVTTILTCNRITRAPVHFTDNVSRLICNVDGYNYM